MAVVLMVLLAALSSGDASQVRRCGWWQNPTPGNAWLRDADATWIVSTQGGAEAEGDWPAFTPKQFVITNGSSYGHGCACMVVEADAATKRVRSIKSAKALPLAKCRKDPKLKEPGTPRTSRAGTNNRE